MLPAFGSIVSAAGAGTSEDSLASFGWLYEPNQVPVLILKKNRRSIAVLTKIFRPRECGRGLLGSRRE